MAIVGAYLFRRDNRWLGMHHALLIQLVWSGNMSALSPSVCGLWRFDGRRQPRGIAVAEILLRLGIAEQMLAIGHGVLLVVRGSSFVIRTMIGSCAMRFE